MLSIKLVIGQPLATHPVIPTFLSVFRFRALALSVVLQSPFGLMNVLSSGLSSLTSTALSISHCGDTRFLSHSIILVNQRLLGSEQPTVYFSRFNHTNSFTPLLNKYGRQDCSNPN